MMMMCVSWAHPDVSRTCAAKTAIVANTVSHSRKFVELASYIASLCDKYYLHFEFIAN